jgi:hypothetical protein
MQPEKPKPVRVLGVEAVHRADTRWSGFGRRFVHISPGEHEVTITADGSLDEVLRVFAAAGPGFARIELHVTDCDEATANALLELAREKVSG